MSLFGPEDLELFEHLARGLVANPAERNRQTMEAMRLEAELLQGGQQEPTTSDSEPQEVSQEP